jgi:hypothetical protein
MNKKECNKITDLVIDALCTDGAHHKQWFLETLLRLLVSSGTFADLKESFEWEDGIAP